MRTLTTQSTSLPRKHVPLLLVSANDQDRIALRRLLSRSNWKLILSSGCRDALAFLRQYRVPVVLCDSEMADGGWRLLLERLADLPDPPSLIVCSRLPDERLWAEVLNLGAYDLLGTPFDSTELLRAVFLAWQYWEREFGEKVSVPERKCATSYLEAEGGLTAAAARGCS